MITISYETAQRLFRLLPERPNTTLRVRQQGDHVEIQPDKPREGDMAYEVDHRVVLVIDPQTSSHLNGATLVVAETPTGPKISLH